MLAMAFGIEKLGRIEFKSGEKEGFFLLKVEQLKEYEESLFYTIAVAEENDLEVIKDKEKVYSICEEYANAGIHILKEEVFSGDFADFSKRLESMLREKIDHIKKKFQESELDINRGVKTKLNDEEKLKETEIKLRELIKKELKEQNNENWWHNNIPDGVKSDVEKRIKEEIQKAPYKRESLLGNDEIKLDFSDIGHLKDIIISNKNWSQFQIFFESKQNVEKYFGNFKNYRNAVQHHRTHTDEILEQEGKLSMKWIRKCIGLE